MTNPILGMVSSRKAWIAILAVIGATILVYAGKIPYVDFLSFLKWVIASWFAAFAAEDIGKAFKPDTSVVNNAVLNPPTTQIPIDQVLTLIQKAIALNTPKSVEKEKDYDDS